jgi:predicted nucleic acid-binding protein
MPSGLFAMPARGSRPDFLVDTSVAVALLVGDHADHAATLKALGHRRLGLAGHAAFETFSVLTRLPVPARRPPEVVARLLDANFPETRFLSASAAAALIPRLARLGIAGGSVYDALVAACAREHAVPLATRDLRAAATYRTLSAEITVLGGAT